MRNARKAALPLRSPVAASGRGGVLFAGAAVTLWLVVTGAVPVRLAGALAARDPAALADTTLPRLAMLDSTARRDLRRRIADWPVDHRVAAHAFLQVGTPYALGALGEELPPDPDPLLAFDSTDCTVLVLTSVALAHAEDAGGEREAMAITQYRDAQVTFAERFHFTTDRLAASPWFQDVTRGAFRGRVRSQRVTLNRRRDGSRWVDVDATAVRRVDWVPRARAGEVTQAWRAGRIPDAAGVAFVRRARMADGLDVVHESLLWHGTTLLHASSVTGRVVVRDWAEYLATDGRAFDGFLLYAFR